MDAAAPPTIDPAALIGRLGGRVRSIALRTAERNRLARVEADDLYQEGMLAVLVALPKFDPAGGASVETYATRRAFGGMIDYLRSRHCEVKRGDVKRARSGGYVAGVRAFSELRLQDRRSLANRLAAPDDGQDTGTPAERVMTHPLLACLFPDQRRLLARHYGCGVPQKDIAAAEGVCPSRISQLISDCLDEVRANAAADTGAAGV